MGKRVPVRVCVLLLGCWLVLPALVEAAYLNFESGAVRPLVLSSDGTRLFAVNTPDARLEIFDVDAGGLTQVGSVAVGLEPVAVNVRSEDEVWVVNLLSDSVSIVDVSASPRVVRTLLVGDEPRDVVFGGPAGTRAFVTTAHRGPASPTPRGQFAQEGVGRADIWVFDTGNLGTSLGGDALTVLTVFSDRPRALAVSGDGSTVYAAAFRSGNRTTAVHERAVCDGGAAAPTCVVDSQTLPGGMPAPNDNIALTTGPEAGLIVAFDPNSGEWRDELDRDWSGAVRLSLPDFDVFRIDADASPPVVTDSLAGVGTVLFNMIVHPASGKVYVTNTQANNAVRFEGPGVHSAASKPAGEPASVRGHLHEARVTVIDGNSVLPRHLNKHIDYSVFPVAAGVKDDSLATPLGMAFSDDLTSLYVAAFGSSKIGIFNVAALDADTFTPSSADHIEVAGGGPTGLAVRNERLYVLTRFDNAVAVFDTTTRQELARLPLHNPEPPEVVDGRSILYDARLTSSNGEAACGSCHIFGDMDDLSWDLGDPDGAVVPNPNPFILGSPSGPLHPMKGPMTTQSLRGLADAGPMHWRGDRSGGNEVPPDPLDEELAFKAFNVAFEGLLGREEGELSALQMQAFTDFALELTYPPTPMRQLDNQLRADEARGSALFSLPGTDGGFACINCHIVAPASGFFGTSGVSSNGIPQDFKTPHFRNAYQRVGMFGMPLLPGIGGSGATTGDQIRGFGFSHDGSVDTALRFVNTESFTLDPNESMDLDTFINTFDTGLAPIVGQQVTLDATNAVVVDPRIDLMIARAQVAAANPRLPPGAMECELICKGRVAGQPTGWVRRASGLFEPDDGTADVTDAQLRALAAVAGQELTYTCVPAGWGERLGINRDGDEYTDGLDNCADAANGAAQAGNPATGDQTDTDGDGMGNACDADDDNDGLRDVVETDTGTFVSNLDTGSDPYSVDSDSDGFTDGLEVASGSNPNDASSTPPPVVAAQAIPALGSFGFWLLGGLLAFALRRRLYG